MTKAVFVDRDGTIIVDGAYLSDPDKLQLYPGVLEGVNNLQQNGYLIIVITNQSGISRGYFTEKDLERVHNRLKRIIHIDGIYYCPHHPNDNCECRKPKTKLFEKAIKEYKIDIHKSFMIGDRAHDIEAGNTVGLKTILICGTKEQCSPRFIVSNFLGASQYIIKEK